MPVRIFLSTVTAEFREYRDLLRSDLTRHNVEVKVQEDFKDLGGETLEKLDVYIAACDAVVHLVGAMTGAMAGQPSTQSILTKYPDITERLPPLKPLIDAGEGISYTQWEAWLALYHRKRLLIAEAEENAPRGPAFVATEITLAAQREHLHRLRSMERYPGCKFSSPDNLAKQIAFSVILDLLSGDRNPASQSAIQLTIGESEPYLATSGSVYGTKRTLKLMIENKSRDRSLSGGRVQIVSIAPKTEYDGPWELRSGMQLAPGDHTLVPLVSYGEAREPTKYDCADTFMTLGTKDGRPYLSVGPEYTITIRTTAMETPWVEIECKLWKDGDGKLRIRESASKSQTISSIEVVFPNECNSPGIESLFKRSWSPLPSGNPIRYHVSFHRFFIGVRNPFGKTLRNARVVIETISMPDLVLNASCVCERTESPSVDIPPEGLDYFLLGEGADGAEDGKFHSRIMSKDSYDSLLERFEARSNEGFILTPANMRYALLRNDGYKLELAVYADDVLPARAVFIINAKDRIEVLREGTP